VLWKQAWDKEDDNVCYESAVLLGSAADRAASPSYQAIAGHRDEESLMRSKSRTSGTIQVGFIPSARR
jgi:hypothetical protein